jgi:ATP-binding protein involved in chromosome partitioning
MTIDMAAVREAAGSARDPEVRRSLAELGLLDDVQIQGHHVTVYFHLTSPLCPAAFAVHIGRDIRRRVRAVPGVESCAVMLRDHFLRDALQQRINAGGRR